MVFNHTELAAAIDLLVMMSQLLKMEEVEWVVRLMTGQEMMVDFTGSDPLAR